MGGSNLLTIEALFVGNGKEENLINYETIFSPDRVTIRVRSAGGRYTERNA